MQFTQIQRVSGNYLKSIRTSANRVTVISRIVRVDFFRVGTVFVAYGTAFGGREADLKSETRSTKKGFSSGTLR